MIFLLLLLMQPPDVQAAMVRSGPCSLTVPHEWKVSGASAHSRDSSVQVTLTEVANGLRALDLARGIGGEALPGPGAVKVVQTDLPGEMTLLLAITPARSERACQARIKVRGSGASQTALAIARRLTRSS
jgi:hypothetical protein